MIKHGELSPSGVRSFIRNKKITYAGNIPAKIYGSLSCSSGRRMMSKNRIFFTNVIEAIQAGYRPCGKCLRTEYKQWKKYK